MKSVGNDVGSTPIRIRAHHLLCMQGFQGLGYNKEFALNMSQIIEKTLQNPFSLIKVIIGADAICECCPHDLDGKCNLKSTSDNDIRQLDSSILQYLDINEGSILHSSRILRITQSLSIENVKKICGNCFWRENCLYFKKKTDNIL